MNSGSMNPTSPPELRGAGNELGIMGNALARAEILEHARHPRNHGELPDADVVREEANPLCGDVIKIYAVIASEAKQSQSEGIASSDLPPRNDKRISNISFTGHGCIVSQAAASVLSEAVVGKKIEEVQAMQREDVEHLLGSPLSPARVKCGMLALVALKEGIGQYQNS